MQGMMSPLDDPLLDAAGSRAEATEEAALRALDRLSPSATDYYRAAQQQYAQLHEAPAAASMLGHPLRELDGIVRDVWWDLTCFVDEEARTAREHAILDPSARDAPHKKQVGFLSRRLGLTAEEEQTWLEAAGLLPGLAHRSRIGPSRRLSADRQRFMGDAIALFLRIVSATESTYGDAVIRAAALLKTGPSKEVTRVLAHHFPHHPPLRRWLLAQIDDPMWLRPLHKADVLAPCEPLRLDTGGSPVAPTSPGARATARVAGEARDDELLLELISEWLKVCNPRLHTDVAQILIEARNPLYEDNIDSLCAWLSATREHASISRLVGDLGVLRFPSHCLRLAARALADGRADLAEQLAQATGDAFVQQAQDEASFVKLANLALLGAHPVLDETATNFLIGILQRTAKDRQ